jgi:hypothetical protein
MRLYHGSYVVVREPLVNVGRRSLDFGPGFYLTKLKDQAEKWAHRVRTIRNADSAYVSAYEFDIDTWLKNNTPRHLVLHAYDEQWLDFVVASRKGQQPWKGYDVIEGGVANDQVIDTVEDYFSGRITIEQALGFLRFAKPTHQMCVNSQDIIEEYFKFTDAFKLK